jgi:hypothetical protein
MNTDTITRGVEELRARYANDIQVAQDGTRTLVAVKDITLPPGCRPTSTDILLVLDPAQPKPQHYVRPGQTASNGQPLKNNSTTLVGGESWMTFSYNIPYQEGDSLARFITMVRQRLEKP